MSHPYRILILVLVMLHFGADASAQTAKQYLSYGDDAVKRGECYNGAEYYRQGLEKYEFNIELKFKYAEALRCFNDYKNAAEVYKKVSEEDYTKEYPLAVFWYGSMLHYLGRYDAAAVQFKKFLNHYKSKDYYSVKAQQEIESCSWAKANITDEKIKIIHLPDTINTPYSETNPFQSPDGHFLFSSLRNLSPPKKKENFLARIYVSDSNYATSKLLSIAVDAGKHVANGAYNNARNRFYFTQCDPPSVLSAVLRCDIYVCQVSKDSFSAPQKLDSVINLSGYTSTQPNIGKKETGEETLYFVSDRPGGYGKTDIWMSRIIRDTPQAPVNLGTEINTIDEEFSPFYDGRDNKLYFASNWHYGFGGLDMFASSWQNGTWSAPKNLGHAINSPQNDFYFYKTFDRSKNYFSSNRKGSRYIKSETCCNDIWMYQTGERIDLPPVIDTTVVVAVKVDTPDTKITVVTETKTDTPVKTIAVVTETRRDTSVTTKTATALVDTQQKVFIDRSVTKIKQLLPVTLYFHNDEPECCNLRDSTTLNYVETYQSYWRLLDRYKKEFGKGLQNDNKVEAEKEVFDLFTKKVDKGYYDLIQFSRQLLDILQSGKKVEITIQGYCSPLNYNQYNIKLGYRRIASLKNYFYHYRDGMFMYYIENGNLVLKNESLGEERAAKTVSDKLEDTRNSVYNPAAALERKVEIISVELK
ncbi:MAG: hypothetical protein JWO03_4065 [Bacteroidetes bacterium]|nr:hypothetical protein [Bacteroidota bacterium]